MHRRSERVSFLGKVGCGPGDTATNLVWRTLMVFLPIFYADVFGLTLAGVVLALAALRFYPIDAKTFEHMQHDLPAGKEARTT
jgi:GPH family glycoside/pentoside/hexuronide:cation symporter